MKARKRDTKQKGLRGSSTGRKRGGYRKLWIRFFLLSRGPHSIRWPTLLCLFLQHLPFHPFLPWASKYPVSTVERTDSCVSLSVSHFLACLTLSPSEPKPSVWQLQRDSPVPQRPLASQPPPSGCCPLRMQALAKVPIGLLVAKPKRYSFVPLT